MSDGPEQVDERIEAGNDALGRLVHLDVTTILRYEVEVHTSSRMARPAYIAYAGDNGCENKFRTRNSASERSDVPGR